MSRAKELFDRIARDGEAAIDELIADRASEDLFLDFKACQDNGSGSKLNRADRLKLAKAISGFGNSGGGILIWGVDCDNGHADGDVARAKRPIQNPKRFKSWLESAVGGCTLPAHSEVEHSVVSSPSGPDIGFVVTLIPQSNRSPLCGNCDEIRQRYFMRAGSSFEPVPHGVLAGMFGRQPLPRLAHAWNNYGGGISSSNPRRAMSNRTLETAPFVRVGFILLNEGACIARDLYLNIHVNAPGPKCEFQVIPPKLDGPSPSWHFHSSTYNDAHFVASDSFKLAPAARVESIQIELCLIPPFNSPLHYLITYGATGTPVNTISHSLDVKRVKEQYDFFMEGDRDPPSARELALQLLRAGAPPITFRELIGLADPTQ